MALYKKQGTAAKTISTLASHLKPWVAWLVRKSGRPTDQRLLTYLDSNDKLQRRGSYYKVGCAIRDFCNRYLDTREHIHLIKPLGYETEKPTLAMLRRMVDALTQHVVSRARNFEPLEENCDPKTMGADKLAKYLGK